MEGEIGRFKNSHKGESKHAVKDFMHVVCIVTF